MPIRTRTWRSRCVEGAAQVLLDAERRAASRLGVAEGDHEPVARGLHDLAAVLVDPGPQQRSWAASSLHPRLVAEPVVEGGGVLDVGEEERHRAVGGGHGERCRRAPPGPTPGGPRSRPGAAPRRRARAPCRRSAAPGSPPARWAWRGAVAGARRRGRTRAARSAGVGGDFRRALSSSPMATTRSRPRARRRRRRVRRRCSDPQPLLERGRAPHRSRRRSAAGCGMESRQPV